MILVDSNTVIDYLRAGDAKLLSLFQTHNAAICGVTRAELLHGARSSTDRQDIIAALNSFQQLPIPDHLWDDLGDNLATMRAAGVTVPFPDAVLATVAIEYDIEFWTRDVQFQHIQKAIPNLQLFQEPP